VFDKENGVFQFEDQIKNLEMLLAEEEDTLASHVNAVNGDSECFFQHLKVPLIRAIMRKHGWGLDQDSIPEYVVEFIKECQNNLEKKWVFDKENGVFQFEDQIKNLEMLLAEEAHTLASHVIDDFKRDDNGQIVEIYNACSKVKPRFPNGTGGRVKMIGNCIKQVMKELKSDMHLGYLEVADYVRQLRESYLGLIVAVENRDGVSCGLIYEYDNNDNKVYGVHSEKGEHFGYGIEYGKNGKIVYNGDWKGGKHHGHGVSYHSEHQVPFPGGWTSGILNGHSVLPRGATKAYEGQWKDGKPHGEGVLYHSDGATKQYDGQWKDGKQHGYGTAQNTVEGIA